MSDETKTAVRAAVLLGQQKLADHQLAMVAAIKEADELARGRADQWLIDEGCALITEAILAKEHLTLRDYDHAMACERAGLKITEIEGNMSKGFEQYWVVSW